MNILLLSAPDIRFFSLAWIEKDAIRFQETFLAKPDNYLQVLDQFLQTNRLKIQDLQAVAVMEGPGSYTAIRVSVTLANALAFARQIPIAGLRAQGQSSPEEILAGCPAAGFKFGRGPVLPIYLREPNITHKNS